MKGNPLVSFTESTGKFQCLGKRPIHIPPETSFCRKGVSFDALGLHTPMVHSASTEPAPVWKRFRTPKAGFDTPLGPKFTWGTGQRNQQSVKPVDQKTPKNIAEQKFGDTNLLVEQTWKKDTPQKTFKCLLRLHFRCYFMESKWKQAFGCLESRVISYMMFVRCFLDATWPHRTDGSDQVVYWSHMVQVSSDQTQRLFSFYRRQQKPSIYVGISCSATR